LLQFQFWRLERKFDEFERAIVVKSGIFWVFTKMPLGASIEL
jgi:hypothetical protein